MKTKSVAIYALAAMVAIAPFSPASAHEHWHGGHGNGALLGIAALGTAVVAGTVAIATAPFRAVAEAPAPYYAQPQPPVYYGQPPVYAAPPAYYSQAPVYYAPPAYGYYYR